MSAGVIIELSGIFELSIHGNQHFVLGEFRKEADGDQFLLCPSDETIWYYAHEQDKVKRLCGDMTELLEKKLARYLNEKGSLPDSGTLTAGSAGGQCHGSGDIQPGAALLLGYVFLLWERLLVGKGYSSAARGYGCLFRFKKKIIEKHHLKEPFEWK